jgi:hypothetical protein
VTKLEMKATLKRQYDLGSMTSQKYYSMLSHRRSIFSIIYNFAAAQQIQITSNKSRSKFCALAKILCTKRLVSSVVAHLTEMLQ